MPRVGLRALELVITSPSIELEERSTPSKRELSSWAIGIDLMARLDGGFRPIGVSFREFPPPSPYFRGTFAGACGGDVPRDSKLRSAMTSRKVASSIFF